MENMVFPKDFYFGAATSAYQVEGVNRNDWTGWEAANAKRLAAEAAKKKWSDYILKNYPNPLQEENYISGRACDHYNRFREDFDVAKKLGHNAHRFSIEWSRIEPEEGKFNEKEIEHYRKVIQALRERGIEPFVTLWHWTLPLWVRDRGGWENRDAVYYFGRYVKRITTELRNLVNFWMPLNEPSTYIGASYVTGIHPPTIQSFWRGNGVFRHLIMAAKEAYRVIHQVQPSARVGVAHYLVYHEPFQNRFGNRLITPLVAYIRNRRFLNALDDAQDFIGLQYYHHDAISFDWRTAAANSETFGYKRWGPITIRNKNDAVSDLGWEIYPEGIYHLLKDVSRYHKPIYITENGIADAKDEKRIKFIEEHLRWVSKAMREGVDVRGYFYWSLLDNFEWDKGFWPRFGLVEVDYKTLERKIRPSAWEYKKIIENRGVFNATGDLTQNS